MSAMANRHGVSVAPTVTTAGTVGTNDRVVQFQETGRPTSCRPVYVTNLDAANALFVKLNGSDANPASATSFDIRIPALTDAGIHTTVEITAGGIINVNTLSIFYAAAGDFANAVIQGWALS